MSQVSPILECQGRQENKSIAEVKACGDSVVIWGHFIWLDQGSPTFIQYGSFLLEGGHIRVPKEFIELLITFGLQYMMLYIILAKDLIFLNDGLNFHVGF